MRRVRGWNCAWNQRHAMAGCGWAHTGCLVACWSRQRLGGRGRAAWGAPWPGDGWRLSASRCELRAPRQPICHCARSWRQKCPPPGGTGHGGWLLVVACPVRLLRWLLPPGCLGMAPLLVVQLRSVGAGGCAGRRAGWNERGVFLLPGVPCAGWPPKSRYPARATPGAKCHVGCVETNFSLPPLPTMGAGTTTPMISWQR